MDLLRKNVVLVVETFEALNDCYNTHFKHFQCQCYPSDMRLFIYEVKAHFIMYHFAWADQREKQRYI